MIFPSLIPLGNVASELRERRAPKHLYEDAILMIDREVAKLKAKFPDRFRNEDEENKDVDQD